MANMTLDNLLNRAAARELSTSDKLEFKLSDTGETLTFKRISDEKVLEIIDQLSGCDKDALMSGAMRATDHMIYLSCELLQNPELHKQLALDEPWDVAAKVFTLSERNEIGGKLFEWLGVNDMIGEVKNA